MYLHHNFLEDARKLLIRVKHFMVDVFNIAKTINCTSKLNQRKLVFELLRRASAAQSVRRDKGSGQIST